MRRIPYGFLLVAVILLGFFLRVYRADAVPPSLSWDETSIGYNAYSILKTGRDEHQRFLPLDTFVAFGDYKPPLAIYVTVPFVALFGLTEQAVRLPSVIAGTLTMLMTYFLVFELFSYETRSPKHEALAILSAFLLAISPWHIQLSRAGFEANIATFLVTTGAWLILRSRTHPRLIPFALLPFVFAVYTFNSSRYFVPLLTIALYVYARKYFRRNIKKVLIGMVIAGIALLPILGHLLSPEARLRFQEVNIFTDPSIVDTANARILAEGNAWWARILHNRRIGYVRSYLIHYFDNLQPWFLFIRGDGNPKFSLQDVGELYLADLPFIILGVLTMFRNERKNAWLLSFWLLTSIVPAAMARETPHALRIENSIPTWQIFAAYGLVTFVHHIKTKRTTLFASLVAVAYLGNCAFFLHNYFNHYPREYSGEWQYGYREAIRFVSGIKNNYDRVVLTESIGRPYIYVLFYERYDLVRFWQTKDASFDDAGFYNVYGFDTYRFVRENIPEEAGRTLYVLSPRAVPTNARILHTVYLLNGKPALVIFDKP